MVHPGVAGSGEEKEGTCRGICREARKAGENPDFSGGDPVEGLTEDFESFIDLRGGDRKGRHEPYDIGSGRRSEEPCVGQLPREVDGGGLTFRGLEVETDPKEESFPAHLREGGMLPGRDGLTNARFVLKRPLGQLLVDNLAEDGDAGGAGERASPEGGAMRAGSHQTEEGLVVGHDTLGNPESPDGESASETLGPGDCIGDEIGRNGAPARHLTRAAEAALDLVEQEEEVMVPAKLPDALKELPCGKVNAPFALNWLEEDRAGFGLDGCGQGVEVVQFEMAEAREEGIKSFLTLS